MSGTTSEIASAGRRRFQLIGCGAALVLMLGFASIFGTNRSAVALPGSSPTVNAAAEVRVGTYDSRAVAVAYIRSDAFAAHMQDLMKQRSEAEEQGDTKRVDELNALGESMQIRIHLQGFSTAPVDDILETVHDKLEGVATKSNVSLIAREVNYNAPGVEVVDVTDELVALFSPDKQTLKMIKDLRGKEPEPIEKIAQLPAVK